MATYADKKRSEKERARRLLAKNDLKTFLLMKWERYNQRPFLDNWHFDYVCELLSTTLSDFAELKHQPLIKRLMLNMPPSYGKTEIIARTFIAWALGRDRARKFIYISYSDDLCRQIANQVRDLMKSNFWALIFGEKPFFLQDNANQFILKEGGGLFVTTLKSAITGFHAHSILIDDPIKVSDMNSKSARNLVNQNFKESVLSRLQDTQSNITILMQRLGYEDLCGFLLDEKNYDESIIKQWQVIKLEALNKEPQSFKSYNFSYERKANEPLFPLKHDKNALEMLKKQMGEDEFSGQYQQVPQASEAGFFDIVNFKIIPTYEQNYQNEYIFIDPALSVETKADDRAITCIGVEMGENMPRFVFKDCFYGVFDEVKLCEQIIEMMLKYRNASVYIEKEGGGLIIERLLQKAIIETNEKLKRQGAAIISNSINLYSANRKISKVEKIKALKSYYNTGNLVFLQNAAGIDEAKRQLLAFNPEKPFRKDDIIDTIASCVCSESVFAPSKKGGAVNYNAFTGAISQKETAQSPIYKHYEKKSYAQSATTWRI